MPATATATQPVPAPATMNKRQAAAYIGISVRSLDRLAVPRLAIMEGKVLFRKAAIDAFLASREVPASQQS